MQYVVSIEDKDDQNTSYTNAIDRYLQKNSLKDEYEYKPFTDFDLGKKFLLSHEISLLFLDLRVGQTDNYKGNEIIDMLNEKGIGCVAIVSANTNRLPDKYKEGDFVKIYKKGYFDWDDMIAEMFNFTQEYRTIFTSMIATFKASVAKIFWESGASFYKKYKSIESKEILVKRLQRFSMYNINENLDFESNLENYLPYTVYIYPPVTSVLNGNIYTFNEANYILMTPQCDLMRVEDKTKKLLFCPVIKLQGYSNSGERAKIKQNNKIFCHYFEGYEEIIDDFFIDYREIPSFSYQETESKNALIKINNVFMREISTEFSRYYTRQGSPDIKKILEQF